MSAFLGPIHYWLYHKILIQNDLVNQVVSFGEEYIPSLKEQLDERYGVVMDRPLEEMIDQGNIHGWLQEQVSIVEYKLAHAVTMILEKGQYQDALHHIFYECGKAHSADHTADIGKIYLFLNDSLLDGMPCDRANVTVSETDEEIIWKRNVCVHSKYWDQVGGDSSIYYDLRDSLIQGMLENTSVSYDKPDEITSRLRLTT